MGFKGISQTSVPVEPKDYMLGFNGISQELLKLEPKKYIFGFNGVSQEFPVIEVQSVVLNDILGNVNTFAITNASLEDISGQVDSVPLTFLPDVWTAQESMFFFGIDLNNIRINFDITGLTFLGNNFNITEVEAVPTINILP